MKRLKLVLRHVALFTRAWIEMCRYNRSLRCKHVALFTRAWIEILAYAPTCTRYMVALFTRAWIEINCHEKILSDRASRPLHEGVD